LANYARALSNPAPAVRLSGENVADVGAAPGASRRRSSLVEEKRTMKYVCLVYMDGQTLDAVSDRECQAFGDELRASGRYLGGQALQPVQSATTVRVRNGRTAVTDGPFAETKEQLAGFYLIDARDLNEAIQIASRIPPARVGSIEVRPVRELAVGPAE
jgi:hypothetical protein